MSAPNLETFKLLFKNIQPSHEGFSNKVKASGIEETKVSYKPNFVLERAIKTFIDLDRSLLSGKRTGFADISSIKTDSQSSMIPDISLD